VRTAFLVVVILLTGNAPRLTAQDPGQLPDGSRTRWVMAGVDEVVGWFTFDPAGVEDRVPGFVRLVTVGDLAAAGIPWAQEYLSRHASHTAWGVSFLEVVHADTFAVQGRELNWPENGALAVWFARVLPRDTAAQLGPGVPLLMLEFWVPDSAYAVFMRQNGHYATYADVRFERRDDRWVGSIIGQDFAVRVRCTPSGPESGGSSSRGAQVLVPPKTSGIRTILQIAFAGHRERRCSEESSWTIQGLHPLTTAVPVEAASFQYGYRLRGGAYAPVRMP